MNLLLYGRTFLYLHHPCYTGLSVVCPFTGAFSSSMLICTPHVQYFYHSSNFASIISLMTNVVFTSFAFASFNRPGV